MKQLSLLVVSFCARPETGDGHYTVNSRRIAPRHNYFDDSPGQHRRRRASALISLLLIPLLLLSTSIDAFAADTSKPLISSIQLVKLGSSAATIGWKTNERANSQIYYGKKSPFEKKTELNKTRVTYHEMRLTGLAPETSYQYKVRSRDTSGNLSVSSQKTFKTKGALPAAPKNLAATATSAIQIKLTWTDASKNEKGFKIEQSLNGTSFNQIATTGANVTSYTVGSLQAQTRYYYRVRSYNAKGNSPYSNTASATTQADTSSSPAAPSNLTAAAASSSQINLAWTDNSGNETGFKIEQSMDGTTFSQMATTGQNATGYNVGNLQESTHYYYRVRAYNSSGNSGYSGVADATTAGSVPDAPSNLTAASASVSQINLAWSDNSGNETGFKIEQSMDGTTFSQIATAGQNATAYNVTNLQESTRYFYRVRAYNSSGNSGYSGVADATTAGSAPSAPQGLAATAMSDSRIDLNWDDTCTNESGFKIERSKDGQSFSQVGTVDANQISYSDNGLAAATTYSYRVRAYNSDGNSSYSNQSSAKTSDAPPAKSFPGAVGFGVDTPGGRGGAILKVTNLNNSGTGSLRAALDASGPRTVIFEVSGTIFLETELKVRNPYLTIAGQTAPSPGITIAAGELNINTHDVIVQHIRIRIGDKLSSSVTDIGGVDGISADGTGGNNIVFDHVSVSWGIDENASSWYDKVHNVTFSNCIISEALNNSIHPKGAHSMGLLVTPNGRNVAVVGNLLAHSSDRNPLISNGSSTVVANNVIYNWKGGRATNIGNSSSSITVAYTTLVSIVGNVYIGGLDTPSSTYAISTSTSLDSGAKIYHTDNLLERVGGGVFRNLVSYDPIVSSPPVWINGFAAQASEVVESDVLMNAGARPADRDAVDERIVNSVISRNGRIIDSPSQVGGLPQLSVQYRTINVPSDANDDDDNDGYTNFEETVLFPMAAAVEGTP